MNIPVADTVILRPGVGTRSGGGRLFLTNLCGRNYMKMTKVSLGGFRVRDP